MENLTYKYGWLSVPPIPAPLAGTSLYSVASQDGDFIFVGNGTLGIFFDCITLTWGNSFPFPYANGGMTITRRNKHGNFAMYNNNIIGNIALCNFDGVYKYPGYAISVAGSSVFGNGYVGGGWINTGAVFNLGLKGGDWDNYYFIGFSEKYGPVSYIVIGFDLNTGNPAIQFNNTGLPFGNVYAGPYVSGVSTQTPKSIVGLLTNNQALLHGTTICDQGIYENWVTSVIPSAGTVYFTASSPPNSLQGYFNCTAYFPVGGYFENPTGFGYVLGQIPGAIITDNYYVQLNGNNLTYVNLTPEKVLVTNTGYNFWEHGVFNGAITLETPILNGTNVNPNMGNYNGDIFIYPSTMINAGNTYGFFKSDFSAGWILGIGISAFSTYNMQNYVRKNK